MKKLVNNYLVMLLILITVLVLISLVGCETERKREMKVRVVYSVTATNNMFTGVETTDTINIICTPPLAIQEGDLDDVNGYTYAKDIKLFSILEVKVIK